MEKPVFVVLFRFNLAGLSLNFDNKNMKKCKHKKIPPSGEIFLCFLLRGEMRSTASQGS
ncbi:hypothetical protein ACVBEE_12830 [Acinetobacter sp. ANC 3781]